MNTGRLRDRTNVVKTNRGEWIEEHICMGLNMSTCPELLHACIVERPTVAAAEG